MSAEETSPLGTDNGAPADTGTLVVSEDASSPAAQVIAPDQAARAWIDYLRLGGAMPERDNLIGLLEALVISYVPRPLPPAASAGPDVKMIVVDTSHNRKFPHMIDTQNGRLSEEDGTWNQCKTKMTHFCVRLVDSDGKPVRGTDVQEGGLVLRLTMHKVTADLTEPLDDDSNPRPHEGLFRGRANRAFDPEVTLTESRHEFRFQVMLLSSDIGGARMFVRVAPVDSQLALNPNLTVQSRSFISRARMPDESYAPFREAQHTAKRQAAASQLLTMALTLANAQAPSPPASVDADSPDEPPSKRPCSPEASDVAGEDAF